MESKRHINSSHPSKIWWAYDPAGGSDKIHQNTLKVLAPFATALGTSVTPVSILDPFRLDERGDSITALLPVLKCDEIVLKKNIQSRFERMIKGARLKNINPPVLVINPKNEPLSLRDKSALLNRTARRGNAELIAISSHQKRGVSRLFFGSFSETFIASSSLVTLIIPPLASPSARIERVIFASDFSPESKAALKNFLILARLMSAKVTIVHYLRSYESTEKILAEDIAQTKANELLSIARKSRVEASFEILYEGSSFDPAGEIVKYSKGKRYGLIALASQSGPIRASILGATSREISRLSTCPVLIYRHPS